MLRAVYTGTLYALSPVLLAWLLRTARRRGSRRLPRERLGRYRPCDARLGQRPSLWLHCASVGEVRTAAPLVRTLAQRRPELPLVVTTATPTGAETAERTLGAVAEHAYQPIDWPGAVARFLRAFRPGAAVILETEIWPNLFAAVQRRGIPLILANARLSSRSLNAPAIIRRLQASALARVDAVLARSGEDARRFRGLGVAAERIRTLGSLKLAASSAPPAEPFPFGRPTVLAASTHDDEELRIAAAWARARSERSVPRLLVIAPRHPERGASIRDALRRAGYRVALRSAGEDWAQAEIYVADTLGELEQLMAAAELVIVGGSLVPRGGQNLVEPARLGRPILFGPYMANFAEESERLLAAGGARRVLDEADLQQAVKELFRDAQSRRQLGEHAAAAVVAAQDIAGLYADAILEQLEPGEGAPGDSGR